MTVPLLDLAGASEQLDAETLAQRLEEKAEELRNDPTLTEDEREQKMKEERLRIGIEKMRLAHKKRVAIKVFNPDRSNKTVVVEDGMTTNMVCHLLVVKNHFDESPSWVLVEQLGDVSLERELEDHENVVDVHGSWPREHNNVFLFKQNEKKYDLFEDPIVMSQAILYNVPQTNFPFYSAEIFPRQLAFFSSSQCENGHAGTYRKGSQDIAAGILFFNISCA